MSKVKTILSYSLGLIPQNKRRNLNYYLEGVKKNADNYKNVFPDATMVLYHDDTVPKEVLDYVKERGVVLKPQPKATGWEVTAWRFKELANADENTVVILQDVDSAINVEDNMLPKLRDILYESDKKAMLHHGPVSVGKLKKRGKWMMAGQTQFNCKIDLDFDAAIKEHLKIENTFHFDETFLAKYVFPQVSEDMLINMERRALPTFMEVIKANHQTPNWLKEGKTEGRIITHLTAK